MRRIAILAALTFALPQPVSAHIIPVNNLEGLVQNCTMDDADRSETEHHMGLCLGFIKGVTNTLAVHELLKVCIPSTLENGDLIEAVISRARLLKDIDLQRMPAALFVQVALENAFACPSR